MTVSCSRASVHRDERDLPSRSVVRFYNKRARAVRTGFIGPALNTLNQQAERNPFVRVCRPAALKSLAEERRFRRPSNFAPDQPGDRP
jgi:hypothetical protein